VLVYLHILKHQHAKASTVITPHRTLGGKKEQSTRSVRIPYGHPDTHGQSGKRICPLRLVSVLHGRGHCSVGSGDGAAQINHALQMKIVVLAPSN